MIKFLIVGIFLVSSLVLGSVISLINLNPPPKKEKVVETPPPPRTEPLKVKVSIPYWDQENAVKSFKENVGSIQIVSLFWYFMDSEGKIAKYGYAKEDLSIIEFAHTNGVKVEAVITNLPDSESANWDFQRVKTVLDDETLRKKHIEEILNLAARLNLDGVDIDYERLQENQKESFSNFIGELATEMHKKGKYLGIALHPKSDDGIGWENGSLGQDWERISEAADNLYIMAFGEHWDESEPGPIASLPWVERIVNYALSLRLPQEKLFLVIPLYGYAWEKDSDEDAKELTYGGVVNLLNAHQVNEDWDENAASPYFNYDDGGNWEVWFENAQSVAEKIKLANRAGFAGISFWRLGGEDPKIWQDLKK